MKQANNIFDTDLDEGLQTEGLEPVPEDPRTYRANSKENPKDYLWLNFHVDDSMDISTCSKLRKAWKTFMIARYGPEMVFHDELKEICGVEITRHPNHAISLSMNKFIIKGLHSFGMDLVPTALTPSLPDFFTDDLSSPKLTLAEAELYASIAGWSIFLLPVRDDVRKDIVFLSSKNSSPTVQDKSKQIQLLRYLKGWPDIGPT